jgi:excisionase family DNA binding protein
MGNLISVEEAARRLGNISPWTVRAWLSQGKLRRTKVGSRTMIREEELSRVIEDDAKSLRPGAMSRSNRIEESQIKR